MMHFLICCELKFLSLAFYWGTFGRSFCQIIRISVTTRQANIFFGMIQLIKKGNTK